MAKIELLNVDCMEYMKGLPDKVFDLAIVDPPYMENTDNLDNYLNGMRKHDYKLTTLQSPPRKEYFDELFRISKDQIIWGGNYFVDLWQSPCRGFIFWYKQNPVDNFADGEFAWTSFDKNATCFDYRYYGNIEGKNGASKKVHPTQKPIKLYQWLLEKEVLNLKIEHIDSGRMMILIKNTKGRKDRYVPLSHNILRLLREYFQEYKPKAFLFNGQNQLRYSSTSCNNIIKKYLGSDKHMHLLRHSSATYLMENGTNIRVIQGLLGHSSIKTTEIYTHVSAKTFKSIPLPI